MKPDQNQATYYAVSSRPKVRVVAKPYEPMKTGAYWFIVAFTLVSCLALGISFSSGVYADDRASENGDWFYTLRPSENIQQVASRILNGQKSWQDLVGYNGIDNPNALQAGSILRVPFTWLKSQPKPATVMSVTGNVLLKSGRGSSFKALKASQRIFVGDEILSRDGSALIKLANNAIITLESESQISFNRLSHYGETGMVDTRIRLKKGGIINSVPDLINGSRYEVRTPSAVAAVRGTEFRLRTGGQESILEVTEGTVEFQNKHRSSMIEAGFGAKINTQRAIIESRPLYQPPNKRFNVATIEELPYNLSWAKVPGANSYKFELRIEDETGQVLQSESSSRPEFQINDLQNGNYQIAMRAQDNSGFQGIDDIAKIRVNAKGDSAVPKLPLDNSTLKTDALEFKWSTQKTDTSTSLEVARDISFKDRVYKSPFGSETQAQIERPLRPGTYFWRVSSRSKGQEVSSEIRQFSVIGQMKPVQILTVNYVGNQVGLFWNSLDEAKGYILQISDKESFSKIIREETLEKPSAFLKLSEGKAYFARVKGIETDLYKSEFGPSKKLQLKNKSGP